ncbi:MAG: MATE family efflux transporter [Proteobacteria bacterium]|nr:MATE family efflux transporter [Pseudomonadota bacterium]MBU1640916.1 MATE family efflux transporter [Pseudomonadota bacterium]
MSFPLIIAGISKSIVEITDTIFLARYGTTELAAIGIAAAIYGISLCLALGLADGMQIIIGRRSGEEQPRKIGKVFNQGFYLMALSSVLMILLIFFAVPGFTASVFVSPAIAAAVNTYLQIAAFALLFQAFNLAYSAFYIAISKTRILIGAAAVLATTNICLDYVLIFGHLGLPELGITGTAIATLLAEMAAFLFLSLDLVRKRYTRSHGLFHFAKWNTDLAQGLCAISLPVSLDALVAMVKWFLLVVILEQLGENTLASANIIFSCYALMLIPIKSFAETICAMVSKLIGQNHKSQLKVLIRRTIKLSYAVVIPMLILTVLCPEDVLSIFTPDTKMIQSSLYGLLVITLATVIAVPADAYYSALEGTGDTRITLLIEIIIALCSLTYAWYAAIYLGLALEYILVAEMIGWALCLLLSWLCFRSGSWQRLKI